ncbi:MAG TPA: COX15/CtaA family protein, partial [Thermoanaerobaculia bacterium]|nr:COX15/CtaA family protein [Thermoanaerobaculia bacterium]
MNQRKDSIVRRTARLVAAAVFLLLIAGALVTSTESGLAVPDWPLSYGRLMPPMVGGILYEHGHRMIAALVSLFVGLQMGVLLWGEKRKAVRRLGVAAFAAILAQALLGGLTVLFLLPPAVSSAHAGLAQIVFALTAAIAWTTSRAWTSGAIVEGVSAPDGERLDRAFKLASLAALATYAQILLGAVVRHTGAGLAIPDFPLSFGRLAPTAAELASRGVAIAFAHRAFALVAALLVLAALGAAWRLKDR